MPGLRARGSCCLPQLGSPATRFGRQPTDQFVVSFVIRPCAKSSQWHVSSCLWLRQPRLATGIDPGTDIRMAIFTFEWRLTRGLATSQPKLDARNPARESLSRTDIVPPNWQLQPADPNFKGKRFLSPDGSSWLVVYAAPTAGEPVSSHMKLVAFAEGETMTYLRGERDWIVVSGTKSDRMFYRKAVIACAGKVWHHIAFEYPVDRQRTMEPFVTRAAAVVDLAENRGAETRLRLAPLVPITLNSKASKAKRYAMAFVPQLDHVGPGACSESQRR